MMPGGKTIVVFDIDGTLTDSVAIHQRAFEAALRSFNFPALRTDWGSYRHHSDSAIFYEAWLDAGFSGQAPMPILEERFEREFKTLIAATTIREIDGASQLLNDITHAGWIAAFATGSLRYGAEKKLAVLSAPIDLELLATASEHESREEIVQAAVAQAKKKHVVTDACRIISIGDGLWDLITARNLSLEFVAIGDDRRARQLQEIDPDVAIRPNLCDMASVLGCTSSV
jgi:phosphoglycolate phosphatase-like HAD superfamily hydrolase